MKNIIDKEELKKARQILSKYKTGKSTVDKRAIDSEQWWKLRQTSSYNTSDGSMEVYSGWLWNVIVSKHADVMDAYPEANFLPRAMDDKDEAQKLTEIVPVIIERNDFENVFSDVQWSKLKQGTGIYGIFWDSSLNNGLGDISIKKQDILAIWYEPGIANIQDSRNIFTEMLVDKDVLEELYPKLKGKFKTVTKEQASYKYDDNVDVTDKCSVIDWYYKKNGKLHYCKFVEDTCIFATENDSENYPDGWYKHGLYPFVFDTLFSVEGSPCGYGYIDIGKNAQTQIDLLSEASLRNAIMSATPRYFIRSDGSVNEEEFANWANPFVHTDGNVGSDSVMPITTQLMNANYLNLIDSKINELKEISGNRDVSNGGSTSGVTAASAIAAMQEASGKLSRDSSKASYRSFRLVMEQCVELIRQFYDIPREFRILGENNQYQFTSYSNENIQPQYQGEVMGMDMGYRTPVFDIEIVPQKQSPYTKLSNNELALQFYNSGFFEPERATQALSCLEMMDFPQKEEVTQMIDKNQTLEGKLMQLAELAMQTAIDIGSPELMQAITQTVGMNEGSVPVQQGELPPQHSEGIVGKAKREAQERTMPQ